MQLFVGIALVNARYRRRIEKETSPTLKEQFIRDRQLWWDGLVQAFAEAVRRG